MISIRRSPAFLLLIVLGGCNTPPSVHVKVNCLASIERVAVLDFADAPGADAGYSGRVVANLVAHECLSVEGWTLVEREHMREILVEIDFRSTDGIDPESAAKIGKILGADGIIFGEVAQYRIGSIPFVFFFALDQDVYKAEFSFHLVNVETSEVCVSARAARKSVVSFEQAIGNAASEIVRRIVLAQQDQLVAIREPGVGR